MGITNLLSTTTRVEAPFIMVKIGKYTFGAYQKSSSKVSRWVTKSSVNFPNFMEDLSVVKVNGTVNTYTIKMVYTIRDGDDPNLLEKVFSSVSGTRRIYISYGDYNSPTFIYKEEAAIITNVVSSMDMKASSITYTLNCTSEALSLTAGAWNFAARYAKPSDVIKELLYNPKYGILDVFYGMRDKEQVLLKGLIASDDRRVRIEAKTNIQIFDYLNYLVSCMSTISDPPLSIIKKNRYVLCVYDDINGLFGGPYFKVTKVAKNIQVNNSLDLYEIDVGYPGTNVVTSFSIDNNETWAILYDYSKKVDQADYTYRIDNKGQVESLYSPMLSNSKELMKTTEADKTWWTQVTQYPIKATLTIKGLLRPAILMSYVKVNVYFYGKKHIASGVYIITRQQDNVNKNGYSTTLTLTRVQEDS